MPTSSQAMILKNKGLEDADPFWKKSWSRDISPCKVNSVDLNDIFNDAYREYGAKILEGYMNGPVDHVKDKLSKILKVRGVRTVLTYDPVNGSFCWKFIPEDGTEAGKGSRSKSQRPKTSFPVHKKKVGIYGKDSWVNPEQRSKSAKPWSKAIENGMLEKEMKISSWGSLPDDIISLGFRNPQKTYVARRGKSAPNFPTNDRGLPKPADLKQEKQKEIEKEIHIESLQKGSEDELLVGSQRLHGNITATTPYTLNKYEDACLPAVHLRKSQKERQPLVVCFSLRDNEAMSHLELKKYIKKETGLDLKSLQYEPLSIRSGDPSINGRWVASLYNLFEVYKITQDGFYLKGDHIIVKSYDDVCDREFKNYTFMNELKKEKKQLNLPTKLRSAGKSKK